MIGYIQGRFDILHYGHILTLINAKKYIKDGLLIVGVASDSFCEKWKGEAPKLNWHERSSVLRHIDCVDLVIPYDEVYPDKIHDSLEFDVFFIGEELLNGDIHTNLKSKGYKTTVLPRVPDISSTALKNS